MKSKLTAAFVILSLSLMLSTVQAQDNSTNGSFGIGAQVTNPAGIALKGWISDNAAIASVISFNLSENASTFYIHGDYLMHKRYNTPGWDVGFLSYYYGVGGRYLWRDAGFDNNFFGIRLPGGLNFTFTDVPFDFYVEMAPVVDVSPDFNFGFTGGLGFRYFLN
ncbi:hypothetical protein [Rhodohalobacter halophilus]|uniref:hypothetical protein n=1 Tax=Rhodohalobacter halophilus TaxID=1812810 RepID=UPI00114CCFC0|nr:hypothetical protein [Rhodohalobacter halophilus]